MKAAIVLDNWKLPIFKERLDAAGYKYEEHQGPGPKVITLKVETDDLTKLAPVVRGATQEAARSRLH